MLQEAEVAKLTALLQKTEMKAKSLELTVEQKVKENEVGSFSFGLTIQQFGSISGTYSNL